MVYDKILIAFMYKITSAAFKKGDTGYLKLLKTSLNYNRIM